MTSSSEISEALGKMLMVGFCGDELTTSLSSYIESGYVSGLLLLAIHGNIATPKQVSDLSRAAKLLSNNRILIGIDQEGGTVQRIRPNQYFSKMDAIDLPSHKVLSLLPDPEFDELVKTSAQTIHRLGININFAPCVDVDVNPECPVIGKIGRSFSADQKIVIEKAKRYIEAQSKVGILSCIKHYPGHGSSTVDSHDGFTDISKSWRENIELEPFSKLSKTASAAMTGHLFHKQIDPEYPATLSTTWIKRLRKEVGFKGVVFSDDMLMGAITSKYTLRDSVRLAINAGIDILVFRNEKLSDFKSTNINVLRKSEQDFVENFSQNDDLINEIHQSVYDDVKAGLINIEQLQSSARRIGVLHQLLEDLNA